MTAVQVTIEVHKSAVDRLEDVLLRAAPEDQPPALSSFAIEPGANWQIDAIYGEEIDRTVLTRALERAGVASKDIHMQDVPPVDWVAESLRHHQVVRAGRYYVHGSHHAPQPWNRYAIRIDAGMAFGTGQHETTLGCLRALDGLAKSQRIYNPLDLGCGTGVLAIAIAKTWPCTVTASDIDPDSTEITLENATNNGVGTRIDPVTAAGLTHPALRGRAPYDLITANILAQPLVDLASALSEVLTPESRVVLSGFLTHQEARVFAAYRGRGLRRIRRFQIGDWVTLVLGRQ
ncbi:MAG: 50S ribosomal protein L11 methyltransferase [Alphaproteobacteria bacterium]